VRIGGAGADAGDEAAFAVDGIAVPSFAGKRNDLATRFHAMVEDGDGIAAYDPTAEIAVAVAGAGAALGNVAHHRAGVAAQLLGDARLAGVVRLEALGELAHDRLRR